MNVYIKNNNKIFKP